MAFFDSLPLLEIFPLSENEVLYIKKLNLAETLEFITIYPSYRLLHTKEEKGASLMKILGIVAPDTKNNRAIQLIEAGQDIPFLLKTLAFNGLLLEEEQNSERDLVWLQRLIASFAYSFGWSKEMTLSLYPAEIPAIIEEARRMNENRLLEEVALRLQPDKLLESLRMRGGLSFKPLSADEAASFKKMEEDWLKAGTNHSAYPKVEENYGN